MLTTLIKELAHNKDFCSVLKLAEKQELTWQEGVKLNEDIVTLKAKIENGFWTITLEVDHGSIVYQSLDKDGYLITISSMPNSKYLSGTEHLNADEIAAILIASSNQVAIDLKDINSLKRAKEIFQNDYVMKHIPLANPTQDTAARLVIWHIRAYRKLFVEYMSQFGFLWQDTEFHNARDLAGAMRNEGLI